MTTNVKAQRAWEQATRFAAECKANPLGERKCSPQVEYAIRRVGGPHNLGTSCSEEFVQAFNESPFVDADEDTQAGKVLVRPLEAKDGIK